MDNPSAARGSNRFALAAAVTLLLVALVVLVAIGARASHPVGHAILRQRAVPARVQDDLLTLLVILLGVCSAFCFAAFRIFREEWQPRKSRWILNFVLTLVLCLLAGIVGYRFIHRLHPHPHAARAYVSTAEQRLRGANPGKNVPAARSAAHFDWEFAALLGGIALVVVLTLYLRRERKELQTTPDPMPGEEALAQAIRETIDDLRSEPDPRRAVIAAYARMEGVLGRHGYRRRPAEAPYEYLQRVLYALQVAPGAVDELTELFELAKFSPRRIDETMRTRAINAFVAVRDGLKAAA